MTLKRDEWQGIVRDVDWTLRYVDDEAVYPDWLSGSGKVPREAWSKWEESYKVAYPEYVATQNEKEVSAYAVKNALRRSNQFDGLSEAWKSSVKMHLGGIALVELRGRVRGKPHGPVRPQPRLAQHGRHGHLG